ncbi:unnamed protein product [Clonostachys byssicola]|uniref:Uncharacterized protein n=1 Tax=Clonostachys byssicola TaxID=160290 RepID=A0A9N9XYP4_9HYPO|nr:unnamed protein product [Clonostachys byssicola]
MSNNQALKCGVCGTPGAQPVVLHVRLGQNVFQQDTDEPHIDGKVVIYIVQQKTDEPHTGGEVVDLSNRDVFSRNTIDEDSLLLRAGVLAANPAERPQNPSIQSPFAVSVEGNTVMGGSMLVVGPLCDSALTNLLNNRTEMAKLRNK